LIEGEPAMAIKLPELPFALDALEPFISKRTLEFHYGKHHKKYVEKTNELIQGTALDKISLEKILLASLGEKPSIYNNAAQAWNHNFFWNCLIKEGASSPSKNLLRSLEKNFGSLDDFKAKFETQAKDLFGSGWAWLVKDRAGKLKIRPLGNAGNPMAELGDIPLLTCDVWEHAYYLDYQNERPKYLKNFWKIVNWDFVEFNLNQEFLSFGLEERNPRYTEERPMP
jgi:Fe-Mn family superoxide dismutase